MPYISDVRTPMLVYDVPTLSLVLWDGSLHTGALVIGAVTQSGTWTVQPGNTANTTPWLTKSGFAIVAYDYVQITYTDATKATIDNVVFKTGGSGGSIVATITETQDATHDTFTKT
jgi:hypothetical protein